MILQCFRHILKRDMWLVSEFFYPPIWWLLCFMKLFESQQTTKEGKYGRIAKQIPKIKGNKTTDGQTLLIHKPELLCNLAKTDLQGSWWEGTWWCDSGTADHCCCESDHISPTAESNKMRLWLLEPHWQQSQAKFTEFNFVCNGDFDWLEQSILLYLNTRVSVESRSFTGLCLFIYLQTF